MGAEGSKSAKKHHHHHHKHEGAGQSIIEPANEGPNADPNYTAQGKLRKKYTKKGSRASQNSTKSQTWEDD